MISDKHKDSIVKPKLVIEDNRDILSNILDYLQLKGFTGDCAQDGLSGLHLAASNSYDLIVLDIMLPGIDDYQVCQRLRQDAQNHTPIIILTARDALDDRLQGLNAGADNYLVKPFALSELVARIQAVLHRSSGSVKRLLQLDRLKKAQHKNKLMTALMMPCNGRVANYPKGQA